MFRSSSSPAELYTAAADQAYVVAARHDGIRLNALFADGELARTLGQAGALSYGKQPGSEEESAITEHFELYTYYVQQGAQISFRILENVMDPASRQWGPHAYQARACTPEGEVLPPADSHVSDRFRQIVHRAKFFSLGDDREFCYRAAATNIGIQVADTKTSLRPARKRAEGLANEPDWISHANQAVELAATLSLQAVLAASQQGQPGEDLPSLHIRIDPLNTADYSNDRSPTQVVTIYDNLV